MDDRRDDTLTTKMATQTADETQQNKTLNTVIENEPQMKTRVVQTANWGPVHVHIQGQSLDNVFPGFKL